MRPPLRGRPWTATDQTGGDTVVDEVRRRHPGPVVKRLDATHPGDAVATILGFLVDPS